MRRSWSVYTWMTLGLFMGGCGSSEPPAPEPPPVQTQASAPSPVQESSSSEPVAVSESAAEESVSEEPVSESGSSYDGSLSSEEVYRRETEMSQSGFPDSYGRSGQPMRVTSTTVQGSNQGPGLMPGVGNSEMSLLLQLGLLDAGLDDEGDYSTRATKAFEVGNVQRAYDLLIASSIAGDDEAAAKVASLYRWSNIAKRPTLGLKIAVGLDFENPSTVSPSELKPIGTSLQSALARVAFQREDAAGGQPGRSNASSSSSSYDQDVSSGYGGGPQSSPSGILAGGSTSGAGSSATAPISGLDRILTDAAGELPTKVAEELDKQHALGVWSVAFQEESFKRPTATPAGGAGQGMNPNGASMGMPGEFRGMSEESFLRGSPNEFSGSPQRFPFQNGGGPAVGAIARGASDGSLFSPPPAESQDFSMQGSSSSGMPTPGMPSSMPQGFGGPQGFGQGLPGPGGFPGSMGMPPSGAMMGQSQFPPGGMFGATARSEDSVLPAGIKPLASGADYIGVGSHSRLMTFASEHGYDLLIVFDVDVTHNRRSRVVSNTARTKFMSIAEEVRDSKMLASSKQLVSATVARARSREENDGVDEATIEVVKKGAELSKLSPIPAGITPEAILERRIPKLLTDKRLSQLTKLGEIQFYYSMGFIGEEQRKKFFEEIAGARAMLLLSSDLAQREKGIEALLAL